MNLHVNSNLALELPADPGRMRNSAPKTKARSSRPRLAAQFIPVGARVLDLSGDTVLQTPVAGWLQLQRYHASEAGKKRVASVHAT